MRFHSRIASSVANIPRPWYTIILPRKEGHTLVMCLMMESDRLKGASGPLHLRSVVDFMNRLPC